MRRIVIDIYDHTPDDEVAEVVATIQGAGIDCRLVDFTGMNPSYSDAAGEARRKVYEAHQRPLAQDLGGVVLTQGEARALWTSILQDSRSVCALKG